jgi:hypothetical protein
MPTSPFIANNDNWAATLRTISGQITDSSPTPGRTNAMAKIEDAILALRGDNWRLTNEPQFTTQPSSLSRAVGASATFTIVATGTGTLTYRWQKLSGSVWNNISGATSASYTIASVILGNAGSYRCLVTNSYNAVASNVAVLTVT